MAKLRINKNEIYIEPISSCNLNCKLCYSNIINGKKLRIITKEDILSFVYRFYNFNKKRFKIYWCGTGEVFLHKDFPEIINILNQKFKNKINHTIMTNGTLDRFKEFDKISNITFYVSVDGPKDAHDWNRGEGSHEKTIKFCKKAVDLGCKKIEIRTLITKMNVNHFRKWEKELKRDINKSITLSLISPYRSRDIYGSNSRLMIKKINYDSVIPSRKEILKIFNKKYSKKFSKMLEQNLFTPLSTSLNYKGVYNCCEAIIKIGNIKTPMDIIQKNLMNSKAKCITCPLYKVC